MDILRVSAGVCSSERYSHRFGALLLLLLLIQLSPVWSETPFGCQFDG